MCRVCNVLSAVEGYESLREFSEDAILNPVRLILSESLSLFGSARVAVGNFLTETCVCARTAHERKLNIDVRCVRLCLVSAPRLCSVCVCTYLLSSSRSYSGDE